MKIVIYSRLIQITNNVWRYGLVKADRYRPIRKQNCQTLIKVNMKTKTSILAIIKVFFILLLILCFFSCSKKNVSPEKPFIIKYKYPNSIRAADGYCRYEYYDKKGNVFEFYDLPEKYNIGDTIK